MNWTDAELRRLEELAGLELDAAERERVRARLERLAHLLTALDVHAGAAAADPTLDALAPVGLLDLRPDRPDAALDRGLGIIRFLGLQPRRTAPAGHVFSTDGMGH